MLPSSTLNQSVLLFEVGQELTRIDRFLSQTLFMNRQKRPLAKSVEKQYSHEWSCYYLGLTLTVDEKEEVVLTQMKAIT